VQEKSGTGSGAGVTANLVTGPGVDNVLARQTNAGNQTMLTDALGSVILATDATQATVSSYSYDAYGNTTQVGTNDNSQQYTGRENDATGLYYYRARYYSPAMGRFISQDPIGWAAGQTNGYGYVGGNPVGYTDPRGTNPMTGAIAGAEAGSFFGPIGTAVGGVIGAGVGAWIGWNVIGPMFTKPPKDAYDPDGAKAPGKPGPNEGFCEPKKGRPQWGRSPNGRESGWIDGDGNVWVPTGPDSGSTGDAHGGPHWDVQKPGGGYTNIYPGGKSR